MNGESSISGARVTTSWLVAVAILSISTVLLELRWGIPMKFPGHRALPGALALLVVAEGAAPWVLLAYSIAMPLVILTLGGGQPVLVVPWLGLALVLVAFAKTRWRGGAWFMIAAGLGYGALRFGALLVGPHPTPSLVRLLGHLLFGGLGGLLAVILVRRSRKRRAAEHDA